MGGKNKGKQDKYVYQPKTNVMKHSSDDTSTRQGTSARQNNQSFASTSQKTPKKGWKVQESVIYELRKSANKYSVLQE